MAIMGWFGPPAFGRGIAATSLPLLVAVCVILVADVHCQPPLPRGINISVGCLSAFAKYNSTASGRTCLLTFAQNIGIRPRGANFTASAVLTEDQLEFACGSSDCLSVFVDLVEACEAIIIILLVSCMSPCSAKTESEFRNAVGISDAVDLDDLLKLRCLKNENGEYCYHELENAVLIDRSRNPLLTCNLRTRRRLCSDDCKAALTPYTSTCCMVSYLYVAAGDSLRQQTIATSLLWESCNLTTPSLCPTIGSDPQASTGDDDDDGCDNNNNNNDDDDDHSGGVVVVAVIGGLILITLVAILVVLIIQLVMKYRASKSASYDVKDDMKVQFANEGHAEVMTT